MSIQSYTRIPNGGFNRAVEPHMLRPDEFYDLLNLRPSCGKLTQTTPIKAKFTLTSLYTGYAASSTMLMDIVRTNTAALRYLIVNQGEARYIDPETPFTQTLIPCVLQSSVPNNATVTGQCLLYGYNVTDFAAAGDYITVVIQADGATFKWSRNGGALSSALSIGPAEAIGANGLYVSFLSTTGYTSGDTWVWTRYNTIPFADSAVTAKFPYSKVSYMTDVYLGGIGRNVMRVRDGFITSVGYRRVYGKYVAVYENHLVVGHYNPGDYHAVSGAAETYNAATIPFRVGWSDLDRPDDFFMTSVNEADVKTIPYSSSLDAINFGITGMAVLNGVNYIYLAEAIHKMTYVGLPNVMQVESAFEGVGCAFPSGLVNTKRGHYFISKNDFYYFDGVQPVAIGEPVRLKIFAEMVPPTDTHYERLFGYYDSDQQEVSWVYWVKLGTYYQARRVIYQERTGWWFFQNLPGKDTDSASQDIYAMCRVYQSQTRTLYGGTATLQIDTAIGDTGSEVKDSVTVAGVQSFTIPFFITPDLLYDELFVKKEGYLLHVDAGYSTGVTGVTVSMSNRTLLSETPTLTALAEVWTTTKAALNIGTVRAAGNVFRFQFAFTATNAATTPLTGCVLCGWGDSVYFRADR
jgi:hypothetical protein